MARMNVDGLRANLTDLARSYLWEVTVTNPIGGGDSEAMQLRCQASVIPGWNFGAILVPFKGTPGIKFPGKLNMSHTWTCTFIEGTDKKIFDSIYAWRQAVQDVKLGIGGPDIVIKSDMYLKLLSQQGADTTKIKMVGCYPELVDDAPLSYDDESPIKFNVTWSYDYWNRVD